MEATIAQTLQCSTWIDSEKVIRKQGISVRFSRRMKEEKGYCTLISAHMPRNRISNRSRSVSLEVACSFQNFPASTLEYDRSTAPFDEAFVLKTEVLKKLSMMHQLVISTGGGVVTRPINWKYMQNGVSIWLDVPLEALAQRIAAVGTNSRPLLHQESGDPYTKALKRLTTLWEERGEAYANASARVSLEDLAAKLGQRDVTNLTPATIAVEALEQIGNFLKEEGDMAGALNIILL